MESYAEEIRIRLPNNQVRHARTPFEEEEYLRTAHVATGVEFREELLKYAENLRLFASVFAGYDHLPLEHFRKKGIAVTNASGIHAPGIAEQAIGAMIVFARRLDEGWRRQQRREWRHYKADELHGSTVMVIGMGSIGLSTIERLEGFGVNTIGVRFTPEKEGPADEVIGLTDKRALHEGISRSDYILIMCPLTSETDGLIGKSEISTMSPDTVLINMARGQIVDTDALLSALRTNSIRGAALDVTDPEPLPENHPLWAMKNVLITPHMGGHTPKHWDRRAEILKRNLHRLENSGELSELENLVPLHDHLQPK